MRGGGVKFLTIQTLKTGRNSHFQQCFSTGSFHMDNVIILYMLVSIVSLLVTISNSKKIDGKLNFDLINQAKTHIFNNTPVTLITRRL